jgi:hypothetical protein
MSYSSDPHAVQPRVGNDLGLCVELPLWEDDKMTLAAIILSNFTQREHSRLAACSLGSARPRDNAALEAFLMQEFFSDPRRSASRVSPANVRLIDR